MDKGITQLKELVVFMALLASAADKSTKDGLSFEDAGNFVQPLMAAPKAFDGLDEAKMEAQDLDEEEMKELQVAVADALDLEDDKVEAVVERALAALINVYGIVKEIQAMRA